LTRIGRFFSNTSLRYKLLLIFFSFLITLGTVQGVYLYLQSSELLIGKERQNDQTELKQISGNMDAEFSEMDIITKDLVYRSTVQDILTEDERNPDLFLGVSHQRGMLNPINTVMVSYYYRFQSIYVYNQNGNIYGTPVIDDNRIYNYSDFLQTEFHKRIMTANGKLVTGPRLDGNQVAIGRLINSQNNFEPIGILIVIVNLSTLHSYYNEIGNQGDSLYLLFDQNGVSMNPDRDGHPTYNEVLSHTDKTLIFQDSPYIVSSNRLENVGWLLVKLTSKESLLKSVGVLKEATVINVLIVIAFFIPLSMFISLRITRPIQVLANLMQGTIKRNFNKKANIESNDEIGRLSKAYNFMIDEINSLIQNEYVLKLIHKENELKMLQSQINPHFLYNTLDTINWAARMKGVHEVGDLAESLAKLMRTAIRRDGPNYTVGDELEYIRNYLTIQQFRYEDRISVVLDISNETLTCLLPKLIIQPLLENAILHNIEANDEQTEIHLGIHEDGEGFIQIEVKDNGVGIQGDKHAEILKSLSDHTNGRSHGLMNVHRRLLLNYGPDCGLNITRLTKGTSVFFKIPVDRRMESDVQAADMR
jgi:two-component system sensor histidine kinase YesM